MSVRVCERERKKDSKDNREPLGEKEGTIEIEKEVKKDPKGNERL